MAAKCVNSCLAALGRILLLRLSHYSLNFLLVNVRYSLSAGGKEREGATFFFAAGNAVCHLNS